MRITRETGAEAAGAYGREGKPKALRASAHGGGAPLTEGGGIVAGTRGGHGKPKALRAALGGGGTAMVGVVGAGSEYKKPVKRRRHAQELPRREDGELPRLGAVKGWTLCKVGFAAVGTMAQPNTGRKPTPIRRPE